MLQGDTPEKPRVLCVVHTRPYGSAQLLQLLIGRGWSAIDRPYDENLSDVLGVLAPVGVILIGNPASDEDRSIVQQMRDGFDGFVLVVGPGQKSTGFAECLEAGADVCVAEGAGPELLVAQVSALNRWNAPAREEAPSALTIGEIRVDFNRCEVWRGEELVLLSPLEFKILAFLAENAGRVLSPREILSSIHDYDYSESEARNVVKVYIRRIRKKIQDDSGGRNYIVNARGFGYMLDRRAASVEGLPRTAQNQGAR